MAVMNLKMSTGARWYPVDNWVWKTWGEMNQTTTILAQKEWYQDTSWVYNPVTYTTTATNSNGGTLTYTDQFLTSSNISYVEVANWQNWITVQIETEEARERRRQEEEDYRAQFQAREAERAQAAQERQLANEKARQLLMGVLDAQQKRDVLQHGYFEVRSRAGRRWRIRLDHYAGNVDLMPEQGDVRLASYCAHISGREGLPIHDHHLVQKLVLEDDDELFLRVANVQYRNPGAILPDVRQIA